MQSQLYSCPNCHSEARLVWLYGAWAVQCQNIQCGASTAKYDKRQEAVKAWNKQILIWPIICQAHYR